MLMVTPLTVAPLAGNEPLHSFVTESAPMWPITTKTNFPEQSPLVSGAVVLYLIFRIAPSIPYMRRKRSAANE